MKVMGAASGRAMKIKWEEEAESFGDKFYLNDYFVFIKCNRVVFQTGNFDANCKLSEKELAVNQVF